MDEEQDKAMEELHKKEETLTLTLTLTQSP